MHPWKKLCEKYINFIQDNTLKNLSNYKFERIHFAFLDAHHNYKSLNTEINYTMKRQEQNDVIVCDDYTTYYDGTVQYPGVTKCIDEFTKKNAAFKKQIYYADDGHKKRGYVYFCKTE